MQRYIGGLQSGLVTTIVLVILVLFGPKILQMGKPSEEGKNSRTPASVAEPDNSKEPKAAVQPSSPESSDPFPDRVPADCSESMPSLTQTGMNEPDRSVHDPTASSDASSLDRQELLPLSSIESEDRIFELQQEAPQKRDEAKNKVQSYRNGSC